MKEIMNEWISLSILDLVIKKVIPQMREEQRKKMKLTADSFSPQLYCIKILKQPEQQQAEACNNWLLTDFLSLTLDRFSRLWSLKGSFSSKVPQLPFILGNLQWSLWIYIHIPISTTLAFFFLHMISANNIFKCTFFN